MNGITCSDIFRPKGAASCFCFLLLCLGIVIVNFFPELLAFSFKLPDGNARALCFVEVSYGPVGIILGILKNISGFLGGTPDKLAFLLKKLLFLFFKLCL